MPGRPLVARKKAKRELRKYVARHTRVMTCQNYYQTSHTKATCNNPPENKPTHEPKKQVEYENVDVEANMDLITDNFKLVDVEVVNEDAPMVDEDTHVIDAEPHVVAQPVRTRRVSGRLLTNN
ncbi:hypothetical protein Tco_0063576 [Tanacetum coccineum]